MQMFGPLAYPSTFALLWTVVTLGYFLGWSLKAFTIRVLKIIIFSNSKHYFIYFDTPLYNTSNIKDLII